MLAKKVKLDLSSFAAKGRGRASARRSHKRRGHSGLKSSTQRLGRLKLALASVTLFPPGDQQTPFDIIHLTFLLGDCAE